MFDHVKRLIPVKTVLLLLVLFVVVPTNIVGQTASPPSKDSVLEQIRADAARHAKAGAALQTQLIVDLYRDNKVGLTLTEIAQTYEEEYIRQKELLKPSAWEKLRPNVAWIVAVILALALAFHKVLEKWFSKLVEILGERLWHKLVSSRFLKKFALQRYQKALSERCSELRIPFSNRPLKMREVYVPLKVGGSNDTEQVDAFQAVVQYRRLMIVGPPGSGKSMLLKNLAFQYAEGRLRTLPDRPIPVLLELHYLGEKPDLPLERHLAMALERNRFANAERFVSQNLANGTLMLLLDGLDEVNSSERGQVVTKIRDFLDVQRDCRVLITCRNAVYKDEFADRLDQTMEIVEFSDQQVRSFLSSWESYMQDGRSVEQLMHTLHDRPRIMALARNPLLLTIVAYLYTDTPYVLPHSRAEFYRQSTDFLLRQWHQERNVYESRDKQAVLQRLALYFMDSTAERQQDRMSLDFQTVLEQVKQLIPKLNLRQDSDVRPLLNEVVERSGLLLSIDGGQRYQFAHLTLQEYFAAEELVDDANGLINRFLADHDPWRETVKLWCGLGLNSTTLIQAVYEADPVTAFECLADAKVVDEQLSTRILNEFYERLGTGDDRSDAIERAFGAVAADLRPRGAAVFAFLKKILSSFDESTRYVAAANALSLTNLPEATQALSIHYASAPAIRTALVRMGDLAVPTLEALVNTGSVTALEDLEAIGTPRATESLAGLLWHDRKELSTDAAWRLAGLLLHTNVEEVLRRYQFTEKQRSAPFIDWIWRPFTEPPNSSLPIIAGRIAFLLNTAPIETAPPLRSLDPRIIVPLCVLHKDELKNALDSVELSPSAIEIIATLLGQGKAGIESYPSFYVLDALEKFQRGSLGIQQATRVVEEILSSPRMPASLAYMLRTVAPEIRFRIVSNRSIVSYSDRTATSTDWSNLFRPVENRFLDGWEYHVVTVAAFSISIFAVLEMILIILQWSSLLNLRFGLFVVTITSMFVAPKVLLWGSSGYQIKPRRPFYLILFGLLGFLTSPLFLIFKATDDFGGLKHGIRPGFNDIVEYFELLACVLWLPLVWYFTTPRLLSLLQWPYLIGAWAILLLLCGLLAIRGTRLADEATNPLRGILINERPKSKSVEV